MGQNYRETSIGIDYSNVLLGDLDGFKYIAFICDGDTKQIYTEADE